MDLTAARILAHRAAVQGLHDGDLGVLALGVVDSPPNTGAAAIAVRTHAPAAKHRDARSGDAKRRDARSGDAKRCDATPADAKRRDATPAAAKRRDATPAAAKRRDATPADTERRDATHRDAERGEGDHGDAKHGTSAGPEQDRLLAGESLVRVLSLRGAPHLHRPADVPGLRRLLRPRTARQLQAWCGGMPAPELSDVDLVVELMRREFPGETATKGELSAAVSPLLPARARPYCGPCGVEHVIEGLFRLCTLLAGIELEPRGAKLVFRRPGPTDEGDSTLLRDYARHVGPFTKPDAEKWLGTGPRDDWPDLRPVTVEGKRLLVHEDVRDAPEPPAGLLLFPRDPYLLGPRWLVAEPDVAKRVWRPVGSPGAVVTRGRVTGAWRYALSGRTMTFHVEGWSGIKGEVRRAIGQQAAVLAGVWGAHALEANVVEW